MKSKKLFNQLFVNIVVFVALVLIIFSVINLNALINMRKEYNSYKSLNSSTQAKDLFMFYEQKLNEVKKDLDWRMRRINNAGAQFFTDNKPSATSISDFCKKLNIDTNSESIYLIDAVSGSYKFGTGAIVSINQDTNQADTLNFKSQGKLHHKLFTEILNSRQYQNLGYLIEHQSGRFKLMAFEPTKDGRFVVCVTIYNKQIASLVEDIRWRFTHRSRGVVASELFVASDTAVYAFTGRKWMPQARLYLKNVIAQKNDIMISKLVSKDDFDEFFAKQINSSENKDEPVLSGDRELQFQYVNLKQVSPIDKYILLIVADVTGEVRQVRYDIYKYIAFFILSLSVIVFIIYLSVDRIVGQIKDLLASIDKIISGHFDGRAKVEGENEISLLSARFNFMLDTIEDNYIKLEQSVISRTAEISQKKNEIERAKISIEKSRNLLEKTNEELGQANQEISIQKKEIEDSILYAQRIQNAILPSKDLIARLLPDSFVVFKPRNVVSGDFYWVAESEGKVLFAAVDCTGHGVPGAFMSMVGYNQLTYIIKSGFTKPADILNELNYNVVNMLNQGGSDKTVVRDGMDISLCSLDPVTLELEFAAAFNPLLVIRNKEVIIVEADKFPIGNYVDGMEVKKFANQKMQLQKGDCLYVFSDGVTDQFGGPLGRKFMMKRFKETLLASVDLPAAQQGEILNKEIVDWMGTYHQVDDILVFGVKI